MARKITWEDIGGSGSSKIISPAFVASKDKDLVFTSGSTGNDPVTGELPSDLEQQARNCMINLQNVLKASGSSMAQVMKVLLFVSDGAHAGVVNKVFTEYFPDKPARSCIVVAFPNDKLKVELECIAQADRKKRWFKL